MLSMREFYDKDASVHKARREYLISTPIQIYFSETGILMEPHTAGDIIYCGVVVQDISPKECSGVPR